jgi:hypothetical protein
MKGLLSEVTRDVEVAKGKQQRTVSTSQGEEQDRKECY